VQWRPSDAGRFRVVIGKKQAENEGIINDAVDLKGLQWRAEAEVLAGIHFANLGATLWPLRTLRVAESRFS
jgi:hypothetical protein